MKCMCGATDYVEIGNGFVAFVCPHQCVKQFEEEE